MDSKDISLVKTEVKDKSNFCYELKREKQLFLVGRYDRLLFPKIKILAFIIT